MKEYNFKDIANKHMEIMQKEFKEKSWFWIYDKKELSYDVKVIGNGRYILDRYNGNLKLETFETIKDAYLAGIDHNYGKHILERVKEVLQYREGVWKYE